VVVVVVVVVVVMVMVMVKNRLTWSGNSQSKGICSLIFYIPKKRLPFKITHFNGTAINVIAATPVNKIRSVLFLFSRNVQCFSIVFRSHAPNYKQITQ